MKLQSVYERLDRHLVLHELLRERGPDMNISHRVMPSWAEHVAFVESQPYEAWYFVREGEKTLGTCYLTKQNEIGVQLYKHHQGRGRGRQAVQLLMEQHGPRRYLANINPANETSQRLFQKLGFNLVQKTYECIPNRPQL